MHGISLGITGTRKGARPAQQDALYDLLKQSTPKVLHHGDCFGVDELSHEIARLLKVEVIIHPPLNDTSRAFCIAREMRPPKEYMARNRDIVDESDVLIVVPRGFRPIQHSGTWQTAKYARHKKKPMVFVFPNGQVERQQ